MEIDKNKIEQRIAVLKNRNNELTPIISKKFKPFTGELKKYKEKKHKIFEEYHKNRDEIEQLEWELMTPEEQKKAEKRDRFLTLKAKGEPFDLEEFNDLNE